MMEERVEDSEFTYWTGDDGILRLRFVPGTDLNLEVVKRCVGIGLEIFRERPQPLLVHFDEIRGLSREARSFGSTAEPGMPSPTAVGIVVRSPIARVVGAMFIALMKKQPYPARVFPSEETAAAWLKTVERNSEKD
ncbi:hypothetical protein KJ567_07075 [Candidatus Bipolaricaulota bacterium]|nr:hypothetical protein [Candidatus Bipolaricaulota bacterium]